MPRHTAGPSNLIYGDNLGKMAKNQLLAKHFLILLFGSVKMYIITKDELTVTKNFGMALPRKKSS